MLRAVEEIIKEKVGIPLVEVDSEHSTAFFHDRIREAILSLGKRSGVLILTDLFGATPSNICREFCRAGQVELLSGCNLPMLLKAATAKLSDDVDEAAQFLKNYGNENMRICPG